MILDEVGKKKGVKGSWWKRRKRGRKNRREEGREGRGKRKEERKGRKLEERKEQCRQEGRGGKWKVRNEEIRGIM